MLEIRSAADRDKPAVWKIISEVIADGDTYVFAPDTPRDEMIAYWFAADKHVFIAESAGEILGTFWLKANQPGLGSHVANAAYMVSPNAMGRGIGRKMAAFSIDEARRLGYTAMQFNFVVKSNEAAVNLWKASGLRSSARYPRASTTLKMA